VLILPLVVLTLFLLAPGTLDEKLHQAVRGLGAQRPAHSLIFDGRQLALETRMLGIYVGFAVAISVAWVGGASHRTGLPGGWVGALLTAGIVCMVLDGLNAWVFGLGGPAVYAPQSGLRLATGLLCGIGVAAYITPVVSAALWRERERRPLTATGREYVRTLAAVLVAGLVFWSGLGGATVLSALIVLSVVAGFWLVNTYIVVGAWVGLANADRWAELVPLATVGFLLAVLELVALAALRAWWEQVYGVSLPI
jgi:uncharacterized membrane protein